MEFDRRKLLIGGALVAASGIAGLYGRSADPEPHIPDAPLGDERVERRRSAARGRQVDFYTAVPAGHGDGRGLPVCLVLHGASKTAADFPRLGLGRFLTAAVQKGAPPFVLAGATGDRLAWRPNPGDDPQRMVHEEIPAWCRERGFDTRRIAVWGWSMGGFGALLLAETFPGFVRAVAAFSPAVQPGDEVFTGVAEIGPTPVALWCGRQDGLLGDVEKLQAALPAAAGTYADGKHNFSYWGTCIPSAFSFVAGHFG